jgi:hypothetical protein
VPFEAKKSIERDKEIGGADRIIRACSCARNEMLKFVYHITEACALSGLGRTRLYEEIACGRLDARKLGSKTVITAESLRKYTENLPPARINMKPRWPAQEGAGSGDRRENSTAAGQLAPENVGLKAEASSLARASAKTEAQ